MKSCMFTSIYPSAFGISGEQTRLIITLEFGRSMDMKYENGEE